MKNAKSLSNNLKWINLRTTEALCTWRIHFQFKIIQLMRDSKADDSFFWTRKLLDETEAWLHLTSFSSQPQGIVHIQLHCIRVQLMFYLSSLACIRVDVVVCTCCTFETLHASQRLFSFNRTIQIFSTFEFITGEFIEYCINVVWNNHQLEYIHCGDFILGEEMFQAASFSVYSISKLLNRHNAFRFIEEWIDDEKILNRQRL